MTHLAFKVVHIFGVVLFLGNIIVTGVWKVLADRTRDPRTIAYVQHLVTLTDWVFTLGGVILILIGAYGMVWTGGLDPLGPLWLIAGQSMFIASGMIWAAILIPVQIAQARLARGFDNGGPIPERYWHLGRRWILWGTIATLLPLANLYFMVVKPV
jgi:uncharacterized membrane protein